MGGVSSLLLPPPSQQQQQQQQQQSYGDHYADDRSGDAAPASKKPRLVWTVQLRKRFAEAVLKLGVDKAIPKNIMQVCAKHAVNPPGSVLRWLRTGSLVGSDSVLGWLGEAHPIHVRLGFPNFWFMLGFAGACAFQVPQPIMPCALDV